MCLRLYWRMSLSCLAFTAMTTAALAQQATDSFDGLGALVAVGDTVTVSDTSGQKITGAVVALSSSSLELRVGDTRRNFSEADVSRSADDGMATWHAAHGGASLSARGSLR